ncbi:MAG TPA: hypothetical protein VNH13_02410, partial [Candidatus Acidoferrales bacterium]|nr:hypothetical protein [Candidatus Acidoferrales bacterium]
MPQIGRRLQLLATVIAAAAALLIAGGPAVLAATTGPGLGSSNGLYTLLTPSIQTVVKDGSGNVVTTATVGTTVHPKATVTGSGGTPTGTVTF